METLRGRSGDIPNIAETILSKTAEMLLKRRGRDHGKESINVKNQVNKDAIALIKQRVA